MTSTIETWNILTSTIKTPNLPTSKRLNLQWNIERWKDWNGKDMRRKEKAWKNHKLIGQELPISIYFGLCSDDSWPPSYSLGCVLTTHDPPVIVWLLYLLFEEELTDQIARAKKIIFQLSKLDTKNTSPEEVHFSSPLVLRDERTSWEEPWTRDGVNSLISSFQVLG